MDNRRGAVPPASDMRQGEFHRWREGTPSAYPLHLRGIRALTEKYRYPILSFRHPIRGSSSTVRKPPLPRPEAPGAFASSSSSSVPATETAKGAHVETAAVRKPSVEKQERRKNRRYDLSLPVIVVAGQRSLRARSRDVSIAGVYLIVESEENFLPGMEVDLTLTLPQEVTSDEEVHIRAHGKTVRVDAFSENGATDTGVAVVFERHHFLRSNSLYG